MLRIILTASFLLVLYPLVLGQLGGPALRVQNPPEGATVLGTTVTVEVEATNFEIVAATVPLEEQGQHPDLNKEGQGHFLLTLNTLPPIVADRGDTYTFANVPQGSHRLKVELVNNDHSPLSPPIIRLVEFRTFITPEERPSATAAVANATVVPTVVPPPTNTTTPPSPVPATATPTPSPTTAATVAASPTRQATARATTEPTATTAAVAGVVVSPTVQPTATAQATATSQATATVQPTTAAAGAAGQATPPAAVSATAARLDNRFTPPNQMPLTAAPSDPITLLAVLLVLVFGIFVSGFVVQACTKLVVVTEDIALRLRSVYMAAALVREGRVRHHDDDLLN